MLDLTRNAVCVTSTRNGRGISRTICETKKAKGKRPVTSTGRTRKNKGHLPGRTLLLVIGRTLKRKGHLPIPVIGGTNKHAETSHNNFSHIYKPCTSQVTHLLFTQPILLLSKGSFTTVMPYLFMTYVPATHHTQPTHTCPQCITSYRNCSLDNTQHTVLQPFHTTEQVDNHVYTTVP